MEADGPGLVQAVEGSRQDVLPGVLLHVIDAPGPVHAPVHARPRRQRLLHHVPDSLIVQVDDIDDLDAAEDARVERLPAGGRVERGAVEDDDGAAVDVVAVEDGGVELRAAGIGVVDAFGHGVLSATDHVAGNEMSRLAGCAAAPLALAGAPVGRVSHRFAARTGSSTPASAKPRALRTQLSHRPHGAPAGPGS